MKNAPIVRLLTFVLFLSVIGLFAAACGEDSGTEPEPVSSQAYRGHENDSDSNWLARAYPSIIGTRLDDCQTCHTAGEVEMEMRGEIQKVQMNPCSYCHLIPYPDESVQSGSPTGYEETLNPFGLGYKNAGRNTTALNTIDGEDSDGDGHANGAELKALRYPGDPSSQPDQPTAPLWTLEWKDLGSLTSHEQFLLLNSHKQEFDTYGTYSGVKVKDVLVAAGADMSSATSITVIAPDGYAKDFELQHIGEQFPAGLYFAGLDPGSFANSDQGFVEYPPAEQMSDGLAHGESIPGEQWMMIASGRDGAEMDKSYLDPVSGRLEGEGPYRLIVPQGLYGEPGAPDRGSKYSPSGFDDGYDYDDNKDHNAGLCVRGVVAIRVNPIPEGYEELDWRNGGFSFLENKQLIVYGAGISGN